MHLINIIIQCYLSLRVHFNTHVMLGCDCLIYRIIILAFIQVFNFIVAKLETHKTCR